MALALGLSLPSDVEKLIRQSGGEKRPGMERLSIHMDNLGHLVATPGVDALEHLLGPVRECPQSRIGKSVRGIDEVQGVVLRLPGGKEFDQRAVLNMRSCKETEALPDPQAGKQRTEMCGAFIDRETARRRHELYPFVKPLEAQGKSFSGRCRKIADDPVPADIVGVSRRLPTFEIGGRCAEDVIELAQLPCLHRRIDEGTATDDAVYSFAYEVSGAVADAQKKVDVRILTLKVREAGNQYPVRQNRPDVHA